MTNQNQSNPQSPGFSPRAFDAVGIYVYALIDPRNDEVFYIGKGTGNRVFDHAKDALTSPLKTDKLERIRDIIRDGKDVKNVIIRHNIPCDEAAFVIESVLIDLINNSKFKLPTSLTNIQDGHHQAEYGISTVEEIERRYNAEPLAPQAGDNVLCLSISQSDPQLSVYERTRRAWVLSPKHADRASIVLAVDKGFVVAAFVPNGSWTPVPGMNGRYEFTAHPNGVNSAYIGKTVTFGSGNPVRYFYK